MPKLISLSGVKLSGFPGTGRRRVLVEVEESELVPTMTRAEVEAWEAEMRQGLPPSLRKLVGGY